MSRFAFLILFLMLPVPLFAAVLIEGSGTLVKTQTPVFVAVTDALQVATEEDLVAYATTLEATNGSIEEAYADLEGEVVLTYYHTGNLFGLIPVKARTVTTVKINERGTVEVKTKLPWWSIFARDIRSVASSVDAELGNSGLIITDMKLYGNANARARVLEAVTNAHLRAIARSETRRAIGEPLFTDTR